MAIGYSRWAQDFFFERHRSEIFAIEFVTSGNALFDQNGKRYLIEPGGIFFLRKESRHIYRVGPAGFLHKRFLQLEGSVLEPLLRSLGLWERDELRPDSPLEVARQFKKIGNLFEEKKSGYTLEGSAAAYHLLLELGKESAAHYPPSIRDALEHMQRNLSSGLESSELLRVSGLSQTHFNRLFRKHLGVSAMKYYQNHKMALARHLLSETAMTVKEIALALGYADPLYFSAQFKKAVGTSPKFFRRKGGAESAE
jgi:AraC-like DNA-binding protein